MCNTKPLNLPYREKTACCPFCGLYSSPKVVNEHISVMKPQLALMRFSGDLTADEFESLTKLQ